MKKKNIETSKAAIFILLGICCFFTLLSYLLSFIAIINGYENPIVLQEIGTIAMSGGVIGTLGYFLKAYFGKKAEEDMKYKRERFLSDDTENEEMD